MKHADAQNDRRRWTRAMPPGSSPHGCADRARGAVLLEVLLALALLILGMAAVGGQINVGLKVAQNTEIANWAMVVWPPASEGAGKFRKRNATETMKSAMKSTMSAVPERMMRFRTAIVI